MYNFIFPHLLFILCNYVHGEVLRIRSTKYWTYFLVTFHVAWMFHTRYLPFLQNKNSFKVILVASVRSQIASHSVNSKLVFWQRPLRPWGRDSYWCPLYKWRDWGTETLSHRLHCSEWWSQDWTRLCSSNTYILRHRTMATPLTLCLPSSYHLGLWQVM